jgi:hypothetical protein
MAERSKTLAKQVIVEIVRQFGGQLASARKLHQAFYISHLFYFEEHAGLLTDWPMVKALDGPTIELGDTLIGELVQEGALSLERHMVGPFPTFRYKLTEKSSSALGEAEIAAMTRAVSFVKPKSDVELYLTIAEHARSWRSGRMGERLNIFADIVPDQEYWHREKELTVLEEQMNQAATGRAKTSP